MKISYTGTRRLPPTHLIDEGRVSDVMVLSGVHWEFHVYCNGSRRQVGVVTVRYGARGSRLFGRGYGRKIVMSASARVGFLTPNRRSFPLSHTHTHAHRHSLCLTWCRRHS